MFDLLIFNAKIYTMENEGDCFSSIGIKKGKIEKLFHENPINPNLLAKKAIDNKGKTIMPGLIDSHVHFMPSAAFLLFGMQVSEIKNGKIEPCSLNEVKEKVLNFAKKIKKNKPIMCVNYIATSISEGRLPYNTEIDEWLPDRDVFFLNIDGHSCSCSSSLLKKLNIVSHNNGILNDKEFIEKISGYFYNSIGLADILEGIEILSNESINYGLTGLSCLEGLTDDSTDKALWIFRTIGKTLPFHLRLYPQIKNVKNIMNVRKDMSGSRIGGCGACQIDGSVGSHTASFYLPYKDNNLISDVQYEKNDLYENINNAYNLNYQTTAHAIGTKAIDEIVDIYEKILTEGKDAANKNRLRIEHFEFPSRKAIEKAVDKLHLIIVPQPGFNWMDWNFSEMHTYEKYLPEEILQMQIPLKTIADKGGIICGSSDSPVQGINPFIQIQGMVNFPDERERLSVYEAFRTYTYNGSYATFEENIRGTLKEGKLADFIILDNDPFSIDKNKLIELKVEGTYIEGKKIEKIKINIMSLLLNLIFGKKHLL